RALMRIPWIARAAARLAGIRRIAPEVTLCECAQRHLCDQHGSGRIQTLHDLGIVVELLMLESCRAPRGRVALPGEEILRTPRNSVQRPAIVSTGELAIRLRGLLERTLFRLGDHKLQQRVVAA